MKLFELTTIGIVFSVVTAFSPSSGPEAAPPNFTNALMWSDVTYLYTSDRPMENPFQCLLTGDPVLPVNGELRIKKVDLTVPSVGFPFSFVRCYKSGVNYSGPLGQRWDFNYNSRLIVDTAPNPAQITRYDGMDNRSDVFTYNSSNSRYEPADGIYEYIQTHSTMLAWFNASGTRMLYESAGTLSGSKSGYRLQSITDRNGNTMTFAYSSSGLTGRLTTITDTNGRDYTLTYNTAGLLESIEDYGTPKRKIAYFYTSGGDLEYVTDLPGETGLDRSTKYTYTTSGGIGSLVQTIYDPMELAKSSPVPFVRNYWDGWGVKYQEYGTGAVTPDTPNPTDCYEWDYHLTSGNPRYTVFTDREGTKTAFYFDNAGLCTKKVYENGANDIEETFTYDSLGNCIKITKGEGNEQYFSYDTTNSNKLSRGNLLSSTTAAAGGGSQITTSYSYETTYNQVTQITHPTSRVDTFAYDANGNLLTKVVDSGSSPHLAVTSEFHYDSTKRYVMDWSKDPRGKKTAFQYDSLYRLTKTVGDADATVPTTLAEFEYDQFGNVTKTKDGLGRATTSVVNRLNQTTKVTNPASHETEFFYDASDNLTKTEVQNDSSTSSSDHAGDFVTLLEYDLLDKVTTRTEDIDSSTAVRITTYEYDKEEHLTLVTAPEGNKVAYEYNILNLNTKVRWGDGTSYSSATTYFYDKNFRLTKTEPAKGSSYATTFAYDHHDRQTKVTNALGHYSQSVFTGALLTATESYAYGGGNVLAKTTFAYDTADRLTKTRQMMKLSAGGTDIDDGWRDSVTEYDLAGNVTKVKDDGNHETTMVYDNLGRLSTTTDPIGNTTTLTYDAVGNVTSSVYVESGSGGMTFTTSMTYDVLNRVSTSTDPASKVTTFYYDVRNLTKVTDPNTNDRTSKFNEQGWLLESKVQKDASTWLTTKWEYDKNGRMTKTKDAKDYATEYFYDQLDRQTRQKFNDTFSIYYTYDTHSNIVTREDQNATKVFYHYDLADRLTQKTYSITAAHIGGESTQKLFAYDALNRMTSAEDSDSKILYIYNTASLVESEEERYGTGNLTTTGKTVEWDYDAQGLVTALRYPGATSTNGELVYSYDTANRMTKIDRKVAGSSVQLVTWTLKGAGRVTNRRIDDNNTDLDFTHDSRGNVVTMRHAFDKASTNRTLSQFNYLYDNAGRMTGEGIKIYRNNGTTVDDKGFTFLYDRADRLTKLYRDVPAANVHQATPDSYGKKVEYAFDDNGNRNTVTYTPSGGSPQIETYTSNNTNAYTNVVWPNSTQTDYEYDNAGNRTWQTDTDKTWEFDYQNKLIRVSNGEDVYCEYDYDALGRRMEKRYNWLDIKFDTIKRFYYAGAMLIQEYDVRTVEESLVVALECDYVWGQSLSEPIQLRLYDIETNSILDTVYYHQNLTGSVYQITDDSSSAYIEENYRYEEYGVPTVYVGDTTTAATEPFGNKLLWHAEYYDWEVVNLASGLSLYGDKPRGYDPEIAGYLSRPVADPLSDFDHSPMAPNPITQNATPATNERIGPAGELSFNFDPRRNLHPPYDRDPPSSGEANYQGDGGGGAGGGGRGGPYSTGGTTPRLPTKKSQRAKETSSTGLPFNEIPCEPTCHVPTVIPWMCMTDAEFQEFIRWHGTYGYVEKVRVNALMSGAEEIARVREEGERAVRESYEAYMKALAELAEPPSWQDAIYCNPRNLSSEPVVLGPLNNWGMGLGQAPDWFANTLSWGIAISHGIAAAVALGSCFVPVGAASAPTFGSGVLVSSEGVVLSGHGGFVAGSGTVTIPEGTTLTIWTSPGGTIPNALGNAIESGVVNSTQFSNTMIGSRSFLPGAQIPNLTLLPMEFATVGTPITVSTPTLLSTLLSPGMGHVQWAACLCGL